MTDKEKFFNSPEFQAIKRAVDIKLTEALELREIQWLDVALGTDTGPLGLVGTDPKLPPEKTSIPTKPPPAAWSQHNQPKQQC